MWNSCDRHGYPEEESVVTEQVSHESLMRYLDGEAAPEERARIDAVVADSTELQRDLVVFRTMKSDLQAMTFGLANDQSVWGAVHRRITRPLGWLLISVGFLTWILYGSYLYIVSAIVPWEKLATSAIGRGILFLFGTVIYERRKEWLTDPYRNVYR
jgi:hypothetical protein